MASEAEVQVQEALHLVVEAEKHTPGPWTVDPMRGPDGELCFHSIIAGTDGWDCIASTWAGPNEANARLIAAAPSLFSYVQSRAAAGDTEARLLVEKIHGRS